MGFRKNIKIRFLITLVVSLLVTGGVSLRKLLSAGDTEEKRYSSSQSGECSLKPTWDTGKMCPSSFLQSKRCPLEFVFNYEDVPELSTFWQAFGKDQPQSSYLLTDQSSLKDVFPNLHLVVSLFVILKLIIQLASTRQANEAVTKKSSSFLEKYLLIDLKSMLTSIIPSSFGSLGHKLSKDGTLPLKGEKKDNWMYDSFKKVVHSPEYQIYSVLNRLASYRSFDTSTQRSAISFTVLAEAGFSNTGVNSVVVCEGCKNSVDVSEFTSPAVEAKYHKDGCPFMQDCSPVLPSSNHQGSLGAQASNRDGYPRNQETHAAISSHHGNQVAGAAISSHHGNQVAGAAINSHHGNQVAGAAISSHHGNQVAGAAISSHHGNQVAGAAVSSYHGNHIVYDLNITTDSVEDYESTLIEQVPLSIDTLPTFKNETSSSSIQPQTSEQRLFNQPPLPAHAMACLPHSSTCPEAAAAGKRVQQQAAQVAAPAQQKPPQAAAPVQQQPPQAAAPVQQQPPQAAAPVQQQQPQAAALGQEQTNATTVQGQTNEATTLKELHNASAINYEEMGACALPVASDLLAVADVDNYNSSLFDSVEIKPEHYDCQDAKEDHRATCIKNPGHFANIPIKQLRPNHMPSSISDSSVLELINLFAKLTVRIEVRTTSDSRPDSPENKGGSKRCGTGMAIVRAAAIDEDDVPANNARPSGKWNTFKKFLPLGKSKGFIYIQTNRHLVFDKYEAENTLVEFCFDSPNRKESVIAKGVSIKHSQILGDYKSVLKCRISDLSVIDFVMETENKIDALIRGFPEGLKKELIKRVFVISHPHGGEKVLSYGEYVLVKYRLRIGTKDGVSKPELVKINNHTQISQNPSEIRKVLLYTADTCEGSSGATVISFKKMKLGNTEEIVLDLWMHSGVCRKHGLNASTMKVLTEEDVANHGTTEIYRPSVQEAQEAEADSAANQVVSCPVFVVFGSSSHPAYAVYRKRLESFPDPFNHVHSTGDLADAGFFYAGYGDCVRCFHCGLGLRSWLPGDGIFEEHYRNRPDCQFLQMKLKASGVNPSSLQSPDDLRALTPAQSQTTSNSENTSSLQQPMLSVAQMAQGSPGKGSLLQSQIMKHATDFVVPNRQQEIVVATVSRSTAPNNDLSTDLNTSVVSVLEREQQYLKQLLTCKICLKNQVKDLFLPCGELVACLECSKLFSHCPSCGTEGVGSSWLRQLILLAYNIASRFHQDLRNIAVQTL